tara:strand:+ start:274 stop:600 length:327 start_codon:yes stop_codon:yes gene_type:complete
MLDTFDTFNAAFGGNSIDPVASDNFQSRFLSNTSQTTTNKIIHPASSKSRGLGRTYKDFRQQTNRQDDDNKPPAPYRRRRLLSCFEVSLKAVNKTTTTEARPNPRKTR